LIIFENVSLIKNNTKILDNVNFHIRKGDFVFLFGPSGSGKSSILRLIHIDMFPTIGTISVQDLDTKTIKKSKVPFLRRSIGFIFQDYKLIKEKTVLENVSFALEVTGTKGKLVKAKAIQALNTVGMGNRLNHFPEQLSGGESQRTSIARAIALEPFILLADEPTGNLDTDNAQAIFDILLKINIAGTAVLMATHKEEFVAGNSAKIIRMNSGRITECTP